jgi:universal stress protein A
MRFTEILFPTDFSSASEAAGRVAREMAVQAGARLHVVYVVPPITEPSLAAETLTRIARSLGEGLTVETALLSGWAGKNIVDYARDKHIDLIVLGTHGRTGVSHAILGSVAETVVRLAPCLVLTVPAALVVAQPGAAPAPRPSASAAAAPRPCLVCGYRGDELICESCRTRIRAQALEQKLEAERPARRGSPV